MLKFEGYIKKTTGEILDYVCLASIVDRDFFFVVCASSYTWWSIRFVIFCGSFRSISNWSLLHELSCFGSRPCQILIPMLPRNGNLPYAWLFLVHGDPKDQVLVKSKMQDLDWWRYNRVKYLVDNLTITAWF